MAAAVALPSDEFFSESYMDAFYKAHVASSRTRGSGTLDEDIAAIEAEIRKVQHYRSKFRSYRCDQHQQQQQQLNSCGNSECSDEEEAEDASPTSVFKVYDSSCCKMEREGLSPHTYHKSPDIFSWAAAQQVQHDHNYCCELTSKEAQTTSIDHGTININTIRWQDLSPAGRAHTVQKLSCILQQKPSGRQSPTFCSLDWLPISLANWIRKTGTLGLSYSTKDTHTLSAPTNTHPSAKSPHPHSVKTFLESKEFKLRPPPGVRSVFGTSSSKPVLHSSSAPATASSKPSTRHRRKTAPYCRLTRQLNVEVTRVRNTSSCSEDDSVVID